MREFRCSLTWTMSSSNPLTFRGHKTGVGSSSTWLKEMQKGGLQRAPEEWPQNPDHTFMSEVARDMVVVDDCAEHNIIRPLQTIIAAQGMSVEC